MSDGLRDAIKDFWKASAQADDPWNDAEITEIIEDLNKVSKRRPWLDWMDSWGPKSYDCDCGGKAAKTTHAHWCSVNK